MKLTGWMLSLAMCVTLTAGTARAQGPGPMPPGGAPMLPRTGAPALAAPGGSMFPPTVATLSPDGTPAPAASPDAPPPGLPGGPGFGPGCGAAMCPMPSFGGRYEEPGCLPALPLPAMIGDGYMSYSGTRLLSIQTTLTDAGTAPFTRVGNDVYVARVPILTRGAFKIAENESPQPQSRFYWNYNYFNDVRARFLHAGSTLTDVDGDNPGQIAAVNGPLVDASFNEIRVRRDILGLELADEDQVCSIGIRVTMLDTRQGIGTSLNTAAAIAANGDDASTQGSAASILDRLENWEFADFTLIGKMVLKGDCRSGDVMSAGLAVTFPTGNAFTSITEPSRGLHPGLLQPFVGWTCDGGSWYMHGFSSVVVPTDKRDLILMFNDFGIGCWLFKNECADGLCINGISPTIELHVGTPVRHRGANVEPIGAPSTVVLTAGCHVFTFNWSSITTALNVPLSGPRPYEMEISTALNVRF